MGEGDKIWVETQIDASTGNPKVILRWYDHSGELTPDEARAFAMNVLCAAEAAHSDAFLVKFAKDKLKAERFQQAGLLQEFRKYREEVEG